MGVYRPDIRPSSRSSLLYVDGEMPPGAYAAKGIPAASLAQCVGSVIK